MNDQLQADLKQNPLVREFYALQSKGIVLNNVSALRFGYNADETADLGERWNAIVAASVALTATPSVFGAEHVDRLRRSGLDDLEIADVIHAAAFFNWANRLMLSLGEPTATAAP